MARKKTPPVDPHIDGHAQFILRALEEHIETTQLGYGVNRTGFDDEAAEALRGYLGVFKMEILLDAIPQQQRDGVGE